MNSCSYLFRISGFLNPRNPRFASLFATMLLFALSGMAAAQEAGTIASADGTVEVGRAGVWSAATAGETLAVGDSLRTGQPGRAHVLLRDNSVLSLADNAEIVIDQQVYEPD